MLTGELHLRKNGMQIYVLGSCTKLLAPTVSCIVTAIPCCYVSCHETVWIQSPALMYEGASAAMRIEPERQLEKEAKDFTVTYQHAGTLPNSSFIFFRVERLD